MKAGIIMPIAVAHTMQAEALACARKFSEPDTPVIALLNGVPFDVPLRADVFPDGVEVMPSTRRFTDEADLWQRGLEIGIERGWDWVLFVHDDVAILEPGWEEDLRFAAEWRVALTGFATYALWDEEGRSIYPPQGHLAVIIDSMSFGFRVDVFRERGVVCDVRCGFGFGSYATCGWALRNGWACWQMMIDTKHHFHAQNSRERLHVPAPGNREITQMYRDVLPARVLDRETIELAGRSVSIAPPGVLDMSSHAVATYDDGHIYHRGVGARMPGDWKL